MTQALTRALKLESKQKWDNGLRLATYKFKALDALVVKNPPRNRKTSPNTSDLTRRTVRSDGIQRNK